jgi:hypothetical protein
LFVKAPARISVPCSQTATACGIKRPTIDAPLPSVHESIR